MRTPVFYEIRIKGHIEESWSSWFQGLGVRYEEDGNTVLHGYIVDQAALHGVLMRIRDLGLPLVSVNPIECLDSYIRDADESHTDCGG